MFESYELPRPDEVVGLDDLELSDAMVAATLMEIAAIELRLAAMREMYERESRASVKTRPTPQRPRAALPASSRRRRRRRRKRKHRS